MRFPEVPLSNKTDKEVDLQSRTGMQALQSTSETYNQGAHQRDALRAIAVVMVCSNISRLHVGSGDILGDGVCTCSLF